MPSDRWRGHKVELTGKGYVFSDTKESVSDTWKSRPCGHCGKKFTKEGHDACLGTLPRVMNACCGHGIEAEAYVQFKNGERLDGAEAIKWIEDYRKTQ